MQAPLGSVVRLVSAGRVGIVTTDMSVLSLNARGTIHCIGWHPRKTIRPLEGAEGVSLDLQLLLHHTTTGTLSGSELRLLRASPGPSGERAKAWRKAATLRLVRLRTRFSFS